MSSCNLATAKTATLFTMPTYAIIEDDFTVSQVISNQLQAVEWQELFSVPTLAQARQGLQNSTPDVLFLDNNFPPAAGQRSSFNQGRQLLELFRSSQLQSPKYIVWISNNRLGAESLPSTHIIETNKHNLVAWLHDDFGEAAIGMSQLATKLSATST